MRLMTMLATLTMTLMMSACSNPTPAGKPQVALQAPEAVKAGNNDLSVMLMQDGKPVDNATVSVEFQMPAMPQMNMAEMKNTTELTGAGAGLYRGKANVMMAGNWNVTVVAMKDGQEVATQKLTVAAK